MVMRRHWSCRFLASYLQSKVQVFALDLMTSTPLCIMVATEMVAQKFSRHCWCTLAACQLETES